LKLGTDYTYAQFRSDLIAHDCAHRDNTPRRHPKFNGRFGAGRSTAHVHALATDDDTDSSSATSTSSGSTHRMMAAFANSKPGAFKAFTKSHSSDGRHPQHQFPTDYANDTQCRYCKVPEHLVPCCDKLYRKLENVAMPPDLIARNERLMESARQD
jgi:hypothetical protein